MIRFLTAGESHGPELTAILEGLPAQLPLNKDDIDKDLRRRQHGEGSGARMSIESDHARITSGVMAGYTTGAPIAISIMNKDFASWQDKKIKPMVIPRPGHVDLNAAIKYGYKDLRLGLERASARETASRCAIGAVCRKFLSQFGITIGSLVTGIGEIRADIPEVKDYDQLFQLAETDAVRCPDKAASKAMVDRIGEAAKAGDTLGGVFECIIVGAPPGLGSHVHWDRRLSTKLIAALGSVPAIKGVQFGDAFMHSSMPGTKVHDVITTDSGGKLKRASNRSGGIEGGISTGEPIVIQAAMKPISTTMKGIQSVNLVDGSSVTNVYERSDICAVARAAVVAEAMAAFVMADCLLEKLGGDTMDELRERFTNLKSNNLRDINLDNSEWQFGY